MSGLVGDCLSKRFMFFVVFNNNNNNNNNNSFRPLSVNEHQIKRTQVIFLMYAIK